MRNLMIIIPIVLTFCIVGNGQVKEQFRDRENTSTIVVIKEDGELDQALLDEHFDLAEMNMSDQIMITTKPSETAADATEVDIETATASVDEVESYFENIEAEKEIEVTPSIAEANTESATTIKDKVETSPIVNTRVKRAPSRAKKSYAKKSSYKVKKAAQKKYSKKKRKKNKRKKKLFNKRGSNSCYSF